MTSARTIAIAQIGLSAVFLIGYFAIRLLVRVLDCP